MDYRIDYRIGRRERRERKWKKEKGRRKIRKERNGRLVGFPWAIRYKGLVEIDNKRFYDNQFRL